MSPRSGETVYFCTHCKLETTLARVCPKCHRKGTLVPRSSEAAAESSPSTGGRRSGRLRGNQGAKKGSSAPAASKDPTSGSLSAAAGEGRQPSSRTSTPGSRRGLYLGASLGSLVIAGAALTAWILLRPERPSSPPRNQSTQGDTRAPVSGAPSGDRHLFGAKPPAQRPPPPTPPKRCGVKYSLRVEALFASEPEAQGQGAAEGSPATGPGSPSSAPRPAQGSGKVPADPPGKTPAPDKTSGTPPDSAPRRTREPTRRPESSVTLQTFLVTGTGSNIEWILLSAERSFRLEGKDLPVLRLDSEGALALDPRERKLRQLGPGDEIAPGLRPGDLVGHALANLGEDPRGGLGMKRLRRNEPLVKGLVHDTLSLVIWLTPRLPEPGSSAYSDSRPPPQSLIHDLGTWRRDIKEAPKSKDSPGPDRRFVVEGICELASPLEKAPAGPRAAPRGPGNGGDPKAPGKESSKEALPPLQLSGEVTMAPGALIPSHARIRITGHIPGKPPAREVNAELKTLGEACNR